MTSKYTRLPHQRNNPAREILETNQIIVQAREPRATTFLVKAATKDRSARMILGRGPPKETKPSSVAVRVPTVGVWLAASFCDASASERSNICEREMFRASQSTGVPLGVLYAVALTETGQRGTLNPYAMNVGGRSVIKGSLSEALSAFAKAHEEGVKLIDIGCMQINQLFHGHNFVSIEAMFDPRRNVEYAAEFLKALRVRERSWTGAVARYHAGPNNAPAQRSYVCAVVANMVVSGFGSWTDRSRVFCHH